jgi:hypothetical protein
MTSKEADDQSEIEEPTIEAEVTEDKKRKDKGKKSTDSHKKKKIKV